MSPALKYALLIWLIPFCFCQTEAQTISGIVNSYHKVTAVNVPANSVTVASTAGLSSGSKVLLIQMKGATINSANAATFGNITAINRAGTYEFNFICGINGNDIMLRYTLLNPYEPNGSVQLITVPQYNSVTLGDTVKSSPWNPTSETGGVVVFEASDTVFLNSAIDVSGQGFLGGALVNYPTPTYNCVWSTDVTNYPLSIPPSPNLYYTGGKKGEGIANYIVNAEYGRGKQASGGGGGNNHNTGGAGGGNFGTGGNGGRRSNESAFLCHGANPGVGGISLSTYGYASGNNRIFLGGGGGSGHQNNAKGLPGGNGGGIVIVSADVIMCAGNRILANGLSPVNPLNLDPLAAEGDGGGGGGAGGVIIVKANQISGNIIAEAKGARGSDASNNINDCTGPGGGGAGGVVWASAVAFPAAISASVVGGANGVVSMNSLTVACRGLANSATSGTNGSTLQGYTEPLVPNTVCAPLPAVELLAFDIKPGTNERILTWRMNDVLQIQKYEIEKSVDQVRYTTITRITNRGAKDLKFVDKEKTAGSLYYRLKLIHTNGSETYSNIVRYVHNNENVVQLIRLNSDPTSGKLYAILTAHRKTEIQYSLLNSYGQKVSTARYTLQSGHNKLNIPLEHLSQGIYWIKIEGPAIQLVRNFVKTLQ